MPAKVTLYFKKTIGVFTYQHYLENATVLKRFTFVVNSSHCLLTKML